jgi:hypothetical protein
MENDSGIEDSIIHGRFDNLLYDVHASVKK